MVCSGHSPWLVDGCLCVHMAFSLYVYVCVQILSLKKNYLFIFGCSGSLLLHAGFFFQLRQVGAIVCYRVWALSHCNGFSYCGARALEHTGFSSCGAQA